MREIEINKDWLEQQLKVKSPMDISVELQVNVETIRRKIRRFGIKRKRHSHLINESFFDEWSSDMSYALGFIYADGCVNRSLHHNKLCLQLQDRDIEILNFFISRIQPNRSIYSYSRFDKRTQKKYTYAMTDFSSERLINSLEKLGCFVNKTYKKISLPAVPDEYIGDFIRGLFDGDGSIYGSKKKYGCYITCSCKEFLEQIFNRIGFGVMSKSDWPHRLYFHSKKAIKNLYDLMYYNKNAFCLARKKIKFEECLNGY